MIEIRRYDTSRDGGVLEFLPDRTRVHIGSVHMSTLLEQNRFTALFLPGGLWLAIADAAIAGALLVGPYDLDGVPCATLRVLLPGRCAVDGGQAYPYERGALDGFNPCEGCSECGKVCPTELKNRGGKADRIERRLPKSVAFSAS